MVLCMGHIGIQLIKYLHLHVYYNDIVLLLFLQTHEDQMIKVTIQVA